jgi:hypothetical protein
MYCYLYRGKLLVSRHLYRDLDRIPEERAALFKDSIYILNRLDPAKSRRSFCVSSPAAAFPEKEGIEMLMERDAPAGLPEWLESAIQKRCVTSVNTEYPSWRKALYSTLPEKWRVNIAGLGDVGGTLLTGLRLLGRNVISRIGIHSRSINNMKRWECEANQVLSPGGGTPYPPVIMLGDDEIFNCDLFLFCISAGVPPVGQDSGDVRMAQFEANSRIAAEYAKKARKAGFAGIFGVVSDPVDLLCKTVFLESNRDENGVLDFGGLAAEQVRGFGLGVMYARAAYYAAKAPGGARFLEEGRAFGPHGEGLVIANSIENYNDALSLELTEKAKKANLYVRQQGYKPYVAPALSSGSLSVMALIKGKWHYSSTFLGGVYMGCLNRLGRCGTEIETNRLPSPLYERIKTTYERLGEML